MATQRMVMMFAFLAGACQSNDTAFPFGESSEAATYETDSVSEGGDQEGADHETTGSTESSSTTQDTWGSEGDTEGSGAPPPDIPFDEEKCEEIDFLFVIDNSGSMSEEQMALVASFPGFINGIQTTVAGIESMHLGVISSDPYEGNPPACQQMGALVTSTLDQGVNSSLSICGPYEDGYNFMTENDDLEDAFPCAAMVGTVSGNTAERPLEALSSALDGFMQSEGQCNEGFTREDAMLVVTIITDEDDQSGSSPANWASEIAWHKGGQENVVVLSLVQTQDCSGSAPDLLEFTSLFTHGSVGDICAPNYDQFFSDALLVIQQACNPIID